MKKVEYLYFFVYTLWLLGIENNMGFNKDHYYANMTPINC